MKNTGQKTLSEVFGTLTARLDHLEFYHETILYNNLPFPNYSLIDEIGSQIYEYPTKETLKIVENSISRIQKLQIRGDNIVLGVAVDIEDEIFETRVANEQQTKKAKEQLYEIIRLQLMYFERKLSIMKDSLLLNLSISTSKINKYSPHLMTPEELTLDERQCVLLFDYLRNKKIIQRLPNSTLSTYISLLTGHSESKMRTTKGFTAINSIKADKVVAKGKKGETVSYNLKAVKKSLQEIIKEINIEIEQFKKK